MTKEKIEIILQQDLYFSHRKQRGNAGWFAADIMQIIEQ